MITTETHAQLSNWFFRTARTAFEAKDYPTAAEAALRGLEEVVDTYAARIGLDLSEKYPYEAWAKRLEFLKASMPSLEDSLSRFIRATVLSCSSSAAKEPAIKECLDELARLIADIKT